MSKKLKEGRIVVHDFIDMGKDISLIIRLECETDFLSTSELFLESIARICRIITREEEGLVDTVLCDLRKESGEEIDCFYTLWYRGEGNFISNYYLHHDYKKVAFVQLRTDAPREEAEKLARDLAMHVVAFSPSWISENDLDFSWDNVDLEIDPAILEGKPPQVVEKILEGKKRKYRENNMLLDQSFAKNMDRTVAQVVEEFSSKFSNETSVLSTFKMVI